MHNYQVINECFIKLFIIPEINFHLDLMLPFLRMSLFLRHLNILLLSRKPLWESNEPLEVLSKVYCSGMVCCCNQSSWETQRGNKDLKWTGLPRPPPHPPHPHHLPIAETVRPPKSHEFHAAISNNPYTLFSLVMRTAECMSLDKQRAESLGKASCHAWAAFRYLSQHLRSLSKVCKPLSGSPFNLPSTTKPFLCHSHPLYNGIHFPIWYFILMFQA